MTVLVDAVEMHRGKHGDAADLGKAEEAHATAEALLRFDPRLSARKFADGHAFKDPEMRRRSGDHLVLAGLPE